MRYASRENQCEGIAFRIGGYKDRSFRAAVVMYDIGLDWLAIDAMRVRLYQHEMQKI